MAARLFFSFALIFVASFAAASFAAEEKPWPEGTLPVSDDGKPLNTDFETGDLRDWTAEGRAFQGQPVEGDTVRWDPLESTCRHASLSIL